MEIEEEDAEELLEMYGRELTTDDDELREFLHKHCEEKEMDILYKDKNEENKTTDYDD